MGPLPLLFPSIIAFLYFFQRYHSPAYFAGGFLVLAGAFALLPRWESFRHRPYGLWALALAGLALPGLGLWQYLQLQDIGDLDHASYANALWNFRHGQAGYSFEKMNMLGVHSQYTSVLWIPLHWMAGEAGLKVGEALCLLSAAVLMFRRFLGEARIAAWGMAAMLLSPAIASQFFFGFHPEFIGAPVLVLAMDAYRKDKLGHFLACTAFLAYSKEVYTMAIAGILLVALVERRGWRWVVLPAALCCLQMAAYWFLILPVFAPKGNFLSFFFPSSPLQILSLWFSGDTALYVFHVILPFLPLLAVLPKRYLLLPLPLLVFYSSFPDPLFRVIWPNYAFMPSLMCLGGLMLHRSSPRAGSDEGPLGDGKTLFACFVACLLCYPLWKEVFVVPAADPGRRLEMQTLHGLVPQDASLIINAGYTSRFAARKEIALWGERSVWGSRPAPLEHYDYILLEGRFKPDWLTDPAGLPIAIDSLAASPHWTTVYSKDGTWLFRRNRP